MVGPDVLVWAVSGEGRRLGSPVGQAGRVAWQVRGRGVPG